MRICYEFIIGVMHTEHLKQASAVKHILTLLVSFVSSRLSCFAHLE